MTVTVSRAELEKLFKELASKSAETDEDEDKETPGGEEEESIGTEALRRMNAKKRPRASEDLLQEWLDRNGSSSSSNKKLAVVAQSDLKCKGVDAKAFHSVADKLEAYQSATMSGNYKPCLNQSRG